MRARFSYEALTPYGEEEPVLYLIEMEAAEKPEQEVVYLGLCTVRFFRRYRIRYLRFHCDHENEERKMKSNQTKKLCIAGILCAAAVVGSMFSVPVFGSRCAPVQHMVNILCAVVLGPWYGVGVAFGASLIRNLLGLGSLMAFPGSMFGALLCGIVYWKTKNIPFTLAAEVFGTAILGGLCAYPVAVLLMGVGAGDVAFYAYIIPFLISTAGGAVLSGMLLGALKKTGVLKMLAAV